MVRDVSLAEDLAQDALVQALERWPRAGVPENPGAWLMATAKRRAIDALRRNRLVERKHGELAREQVEADAPDLDTALDDDVKDDLLRLMFAACHPVLSTEALVALMELQASRLRARTSASGEPVLLLDQNRALWDQLLIRRGLDALDRAESLGGSDGPYALQAAIAACHARARTAAETDWARIAALYETLARVAPSPVVELNRAVAVSMSSGPAAALPIVHALASEPSLARHHLLPSVRGA